MIDARHSRFFYRNYHKVVIQRAGDNDELIEDIAFTSLLKLTRVYSGYCYIGDNGFQVQHSFFANISFKLFNRF